MRDPLEQFLLDYVEAIGGLTAPIEPQVYDVLLPDFDAPRRIAFDPDALAEHPAAQLLTFGSTLLEEWLTEAHTRGRTAVAYLDDLNLQPHDLAQRIHREVLVPEGLSLQVQSSRPLYVSHAVFWFEATFISDEKEQVLYSLAIERAHGRQVRHLDALLSDKRLAELRRWALPDAPGRPLDECYRLALDSVMRTISAESNARRHQLQQQVSEQRTRMRRYYADLREEMDERIAKEAERGEETEALQQRLAALEREQALRLDELQRKVALRVQLQLVNLLHVKVPRLFVACMLSSSAGKRGSTLRPAPLTLTWDPLVEKSDALDCPHCAQPTFELRLLPSNTLGCPRCDLVPARR